MKKKAVNRKQKYDFFKTTLWYYKELLNAHKSDPINQKN